jgi:hypothetical protein
MFVFVDPFYGDLFKMNESDPYYTIAQTHIAAAKSYEADAQENQSRDRTTFLILKAHAKAHRAMAEVLKRGY